MQYKEDRAKGADRAVAEGKLSGLRTEIDEVDDALVALLRTRLSLVRKIAAEKAREALPVRDPAREGEILTRLTSDEDETLRELLRTIYPAIFASSCALQEQLAPKGSNE